MSFLLNLFIWSNLFWPTQPRWLIVLCFTSSPSMILLSEAHHGVEMEQPLTSCRPLLIFLSFQLSMNVSKCPFNNSTVPECWTWSTWMKDQLWVPPLRFIFMFGLSTAVLCRSPTADRISVPCSGTLGQSQCWLVTPSSSSRQPAAKRIIWKCDFIALWQWRGDSRETKGFCIYFVYRSGPGLFCRPVLCHVACVSLNHVMSLWSLNSEFLKRKLKAF